MALSSAAKINKHYNKKKNSKTVKYNTAITTKSTQYSKNNRQINLNFDNLYDFSDNNYFCNFSVDHEGNIKVADFGLSKILYEKSYFCEDKTKDVKLPGWQKKVFTEKTDVVSSDIM